MTETPLPLVKVGLPAPEVLMPRLTSVLYGGMIGEGEEVYRFEEAFARTFNLLNPPDAMVTDPNVSARVLAAWQDRDNRPPEPVLGPRSRAELLDGLGATAA